MGGAKFVEYGPGLDGSDFGQGLTMVDAAISLVESGHRGPVIALSRLSGLLPQPIAGLSASRSEKRNLHRPRKLAPFLRWLRAKAHAEMQGGGDWRQVFDGLRPHTRALWRAMPRQARQRFEHVRPWWHAPPPHGAAGQGKDRGADRQRAVAVPLRPPPRSETATRLRRQRIDLSARLCRGACARRLPDRLLPRIDQ